MPKLFVTTREGREQPVENDGGMSVMEVIRDAGFDELLAICGGSCSCATCHVYVDPAMTELVGPPGEDENELLETSDHRKPNSRLSCQIFFEDRLDGLRVTIAPED